MTNFPSGTACWRRASDSSTRLDLRFNRTASSDSHFGRHWWHPKMDPFCSEQLPSVDTDNILPVSNTYQHKYSSFVTEPIKTHPRSAPFVHSFTWDSDCQGSPPFSATVWAATKPVPEVVPVMTKTLPSTRGSSFLKAGVKVEACYPSN